jgi:hypothetical protein
VGAGEAVISLLALAIFLSVALASAAEPLPETTVAIIAAAVRDRGFACARPISAEREPSASRPDRAAWIIQCDTARYRVVFEGDTGALVLPLE